MTNKVYYGQGFDKPKTDLPCFNTMTHGFLSKPTPLTYGESPSAARPPHKVACPPLLNFNHLAPSGLTHREARYHQKKKPVLAKPSLGSQGLNIQQGVTGGLYWDHRSAQRDKEGAHKELMDLELSGIQSSSYSERFEEE
jgi:hypothetical protein